MSVQVLSDIAEFTQVQQDWDRLAPGQACYFPDFRDVYATICRNDLPFRLIVARGEQGIEAMACFVLVTAQRGIWLGERKLFGLTVRQAVLQGSAFLGNPDAELATLMLDRIMTDRGVSFVDLGEVDKSTGLYAAAQKRRWNWRKHESDWRAVRRLIAVPASFQDYLASLRSSTRKAALRDQRIFAKLDPRFRVMTRPEDMADFLADAAIVGKATYQSHFGMSLDASDWRLQMFQEKAQVFGLFAYVAYVDGAPVAFAWGETSYDTFYFRMTGYDAALQKHCAGTAMLLYVIEHLIANRICVRFDFGVRDMDYKERFATTAIACTKINISSFAQPAAALIAGMDGIGNASKPRLLRLVGGPSGLQKFKKMMRV